MTPTRSAAAPSRAPLARLAGWWSGLGFAGRLGFVAAAALVVRTVQTLNHRDHPVVGDALTYHLRAGWLAAGEGFRQPYLDVPTAEHPPAFIALLAGFDLLGADGVLAQKLLLGPVGTVTVVLVGLLGRRVAGPAVGLLAAAIAAVHPLLWLPDGGLMSESLYGVFVAGSLLAAYRLLDRPAHARAAVLGACLALATLTRGEGLLLLPLLALVVALRGTVPRRTRWAQIATMTAAFALVLGPWTVRNLATFEEPVLVSTNAYAIFAGANCDVPYHTAAIGLWHYPCYRDGPPGDESQRALAYRTRGLDYAREHLDRVPLVVAARVGRVWDLYRPAQMVFYESTEGRPMRSSRVGVALFWFLLPFAAAGAVLLHRRGRTPLVLVAPAVMVTLTAAVTYGSTRFRFAAEPGLIVLAAVALHAVLAGRLRGPAARPRA